jgi:hypothetical protein
MVLEKEAPPMSTPVIRSLVPDRSPRLAARAVLVLLASLVASTLAPAPALAGPGPGVTFVGAIETLPAGVDLVGDWTVTHVTIHVAATATIDQSKAAAAIGALVQVKGTPRPDRSIDATSIKVLGRPIQPPRQRPVEVIGVVVTLPAGADLVGDWLVGQITAHVTAATRIDQRLGPVAVGALVRVKGTLRADRSVDALEIDVARPAQPPRDCSLTVLDLAPTAAAPSGAEGIVIARRIVFADASEREDLKVAVGKLLPATAYDVVVDGVNAGLIVTDEHGEGHLFLSSADVPGAEPLPAELRPLAERRHVEVLAAAIAALEGDFADAETQPCGHRVNDYLALALLQDADGAPRGVVVATIKGDLQAVRLAAWGLAPGSTVALLVDGTALGNLTARDDGTVHAIFSTSPGAGGRPLPPEVLPVGDLLHAELHAADGSTIASGDFALPPGE